MTTAWLRTIKASFTALLLSTAPPALAEPWTTVSGTYGVSVAGLSVATLVLDATFNDQAYRLTGSGRVTGIASIIAPTEGASRSSGTFNGVRAVPDAFSHNESSRERSVTITMDMRGGDVKHVAVAPQIDLDPKRVPVQAEHLRNVLDPFSAIIVRLPGDGPLISERACNRSIPIYNGWHRFDVTLHFAGTREVRSETGYAGPVVVCEARYRPVAGHRPWKESVKRAEQTRVEVWLAPIEGTRVLLPYRASVDTVLGRAVLQARKFDISKNERRSAAN